MWYGNIRTAAINLRLFQLGKNQCGMETLQKLHEGIHHCGWVRTSVVWKLNHHKLVKNENDGWVRTSVVWKHPIKYCYHSNTSLGKNQCGMETSNEYSEIGSYNVG